jgi:hypothetical protein
MTTKYRIKRRAHGWAVQQQLHHSSDYGLTFKQVWRTIATHRWHWLAAFRLAWLREWAR